MQGGEGPWNCTGLSPMRSDITVVQEDARQRGPVRSGRFITERHPNQALPSFGRGPESMNTGVRTGGASVFMDAGSSPA
jgi:hypothetical protein